MKIPSHSSLKFRKTIINNLAAWVNAKFKYKFKYKRLSWNNKEALKADQDKFILVTYFQNGKWWIVSCENTQ